MSDQNQSASTPAQAIPFKAETRQLLDILIHSLYTEREIFLRELISNASDALTRFDFKFLTDREVQNPEAELGIWISSNESEKTITIVDTGDGMTEPEMIENIGTIAHSGARAFIDASDKLGGENVNKLSDLIGQFGVGFYSVFMVAESVRVISRSMKIDAQPAAWYCTGTDTYTIEPAEKVERGTTVIIKLKDDASEFAKEFRLREIIRRHSDFIPYPIYLGEKKEQVNKRTAIWRQAPRTLEKKDYDEFYRQLTLDFEDPLAYAHMNVDAPVQLFAILFCPTSPERNMFSLRKDNGLKLYARKVLIQEYCKELLPEYLNFIQGVVDSEDLPLNVSRESIQSTKTMAQLKKLVTGKAIDMLKKLADEDPNTYSNFWKGFGRYLKQGIAIEPNDPDALYPLLRFHTTTQPEILSSLDEYVQRMKTDQPAIYYILGDDEHSILYSPHLDIVRKHDYEVLLLADPLDSFMLVRFKEYQGHPLTNVAQADLKPPPTSEAASESQESVPAEDWGSLVDRFKTQLADRVTDVRITDRLTDSPSRLIDPEGSPAQEMQRVYRFLKEDFQMPKKILELNPRHPIIAKLNGLAKDDTRNPLIIEQIFEDALLIEGLLQDPASMIGRIQKIMQEALR
jgi:HSP90 family molecular chaperone